MNKVNGKDLYAISDDDYELWSLLINSKVFHPTRGEGIVNDVEKRANIMPLLHTVFNQESVLINTNGVFDLNLEFIISADIYEKIGRQLNEIEQINNFNKSLLMKIKHIVELLKIDKECLFENLKPTLLVNILENYVDFKKYPSEFESAWLFDNKYENVLIYFDTLKRGITKLVHFTRMENIPSILRHGLLSLSQVKLSNIKYIPNDGIRIDNRPDTISISIMHPNEKMLYKYLQQCTEFAILIINPSILWDRDSNLYCYRNAAANGIRSSFDKSLMGFNAYSKMYCNCEDLERTSNLKEYYTTDVQAEVLVSKLIELQYIEGIIFKNHNHLNQFTNNLAHLNIENVIPCSIDPRMYTPR